MSEETKPETPWGAPATPVENQYGAMETVAPTTPTEPEVPVAEGDGFTLEDMPDIGKLPKATYRVRCTKVEKKPSKAGNNMLVLDFEVLSPETVEFEGKKLVTAGTKFRQWFVWAHNSQLKLNLLSLQRGFDLPKKRYLNVQKLEQDITEYMVKWNRRPIHFIVIFQLHSKIWKISLNSFVHTVK